MLLKHDNACRRKQPLSPYLLSKSFIFPECVMLQLPEPESNNFRPAVFIFSSTRTLQLLFLQQFIPQNSPAGPAPMIRTVTSSSGIGLNPGVSFTSGNTGCPSFGCTTMPGFTVSMQDFKGFPSAMTMHCEHCPLAQKIPNGLPSL